MCPVLLTQKLADYFLPQAPLFYADSKTSPVGLVEDKNKR